jgi:hypothetical protein
MNYSVEQATLLARQLEGLATRNAHQVAGQFANLEFWLNEVAHVLTTIDGYPHRFRQLRDAQNAWVKAHDSKVTPRCGICRGPCEFGPETPPPPSRSPPVTNGQAKHSLCRRLSSRRAEPHTNGVVPGCRMHHRDRAVWATPHIHELHAESALPRRSSRTHPEC